jgi:glycosyltransferase involved in cell wall biosynthesis
LKPRALYIFTPGFAANEADTTCVPFLQQFCLSLKNVASDCTIVVFAFQYPFAPGSYQWNGINIIAFGGKNTKGISRIALWLKVILKFRALQKNFHVVGIFSIWLTECALIGKALASWYAIKHYTWIVGQDARATNKYVRWLRPNPKTLVAFSKFISAQMEANFGLLPMHIIRNGVNTQIFAPIKTAGRQINVMGAGSLIPLKNYERFIEIIRRVNLKVPVGQVVIAGDGPEKKNLNSFIAEKQVQGNIELTGNVAHADVLALMNNSRIFLHTSQYDSNATVLHEALCAGCTVISTCPIDPSTATNFFLLKTDDKIVDKIIQLLSTENKDYKSVVLNTMDNSAKQISELFGV